MLGLMVNPAKIRTFCDAVAKQFQPRKIVLFGSHAYGQPTTHSDVDLLVILPRLRAHGERMSVRIRHAVPREFALDLLVRTPLEVARGLRDGDFFIREIMEHGKVMYEAHNS
jgi:predicted nucleotidyltransferase